MISVEEAQARILAAAQTTGQEQSGLQKALGRYLAEDVTATRAQPPFPASAMDGYAVIAADTQTSKPIRVIGHAQAGGRFEGQVKPGTCVRIFTGAPVPEGADAVLIQEDAHADGDVVTATEAVVAGKNIRPLGSDFQVGDVLLKAGTRIGPREIAVSAAANCKRIAVTERPVVALLSTGDELVNAGEAPGPDQIISSGGPMIYALARQAGGVIRDFGIVRDNRDDLDAAIASSRVAQVLVTIGGASVGDHDLVQDALKDAGMDLDFWKIAMRPGKPLMFGQREGQLILGLPGNPVSAFVCATLYLAPLLRAMQGDPSPLPPIQRGILAHNVPANGSRQDYMRAGLTWRDGEPQLDPFSSQDSAQQVRLSEAGALAIRPANADAAKAGDEIDFIAL